MLTDYPFYMTTLLHGIDWFINHWIRNRDIVGTEVIPVKLVLAFTRCSASTRKREGGERGSRVHQASPGCPPPRA